MPTSLKEQLYVGDFLFEWKVTEYEQYERPRNWYIVMSTISIALIIIGLITNNFLFILIILLTAIIMYLQSQQAPIEVPVAITTLGIIVGRRFYAYDEFSEFYIVFVPEQTKTLYLESSSFIRPRIQLPIEELNAVEVREVLVQYIEENFEKENEPASEQIRKMWRLH